MPRSLTQYRVFVGSPGGLNDERNKFREALEKFTKLHAEPSGVLFHPVGWEDTLGGVGRPQELINEDLKQCDYAVFILHDRWGTPTGSRYSSGTEEEWELAEQLYKDTKLRNVALLFKTVNPKQLSDAGPQLRKVLDFKSKIEAGKRYLFKSYSEVDQFCEVLEAHLATWLRDHTRAPDGPPSAGLATTSLPAAAAASPTVAQPNFQYWVTEADRLVRPEIHDYTGALFCAEKAIAVAPSEMGWARAKNLLGSAQINLNTLDEAIATFTEIVERFGFRGDAEKRTWQARALRNKGLTLGRLGRSEEEITIYDDVVARFGAAPEAPLREQVARALVSKGYRLGQLGRNDEEIAVYDDVAARFGAAPEAPLREQVARALVSKGYRLGQLGRNDDAVAASEGVITRFGAAPEAPLREQVARALVNKGYRLGQLGRNDEEIAVYDDVAARFGAAPEPALREQVARALVSKGSRLGQLGRNDEEIAVYDDVAARFGAAPEAPLREQVARALVNKGIRLGRLGRSEEAITVYEDVVARFGAAPEPALREQVERAGTAKRAVLS